MKQHKIGYVVYVPETLNTVWAGFGEVLFQGDDEFSSVRMLTGAMRGKVGAFLFRNIHPVRFVPVTKNELVVGDVVRLVREAKSHESGWQNSWVKEMSKNIGKIGEVKALYGGEKDVEVKFSGACWYGYPDFCLEKLIPEPIIQEVAEPIQSTSDAVKSTSASLLKEARAIALELGSKNKFANADQVQAILTTKGLGRLGNAAGRLFTGKNWKNTGTTVQSGQTSARGRRILVWEYTGVVLPASTEKVDVTKLVQATPQNVKVGTRVALGPGYKCPTDRGSIGIPLVVTEIKKGRPYPVEIQFEDGSKKGSHGLCTYEELVLL